MRKCMPQDPLNQTGEPDALGSRLDEIEAAGVIDSDPIRKMGEDRLVLIPGTDRIIAWWRISSAGIARASAAASTELKADLILRLYLDTANRKKRTMDVELEQWSGQYQFALNKQVRQVAAAIGFRVGDSFAHIVRATPVQRSTSAAVNGQERLSTIDWTTSRLTEEVPAPTSDQKGPSLGQYVFAANADDVRVGFILGDGHVR